MKFAFAAHFKPFFTNCFTGFLFLFGVVLLFLSRQNTAAQNHTCGTTMPQYSIEKLKNYALNAKPLAK